LNGRWADQISRFQIITNLPRQVYENVKRAVAMVFSSGLLTLKPISTARPSAAMNVCWFGNIARVVDSIKPRLREVYDHKIVAIASEYVNCVADRVATAPNITSLFLRPRTFSAGSAT